MANKKAAIAKKGIKVAMPLVFLVESAARGMSPLSDVAIGLASNQDRLSMNVVKRIRRG